MPPPPNTTAATATVLTLPFSATLDVSGAVAPDHEVWYVYPAVAGDIALGFAAVSTVSSTYHPYAEVFTGTPAALTTTGVTSVNAPLQVLLTAGVSYYLQVRNVGTTEPITDLLHVSAMRAPNVAVPAGALLVNDDTATLPLAILSAGDGTVQQLRPFPAGENADALTTGVSLWADKHAGTLQLFDATLTRQATLPWAVSGDPPITSNRATRFYVGDPGGGATPARVTSVTAGGALGATVWTLPGAGLIALAVSRDETVLYHYGQAGSTDIRRWDLQNNVALTPLAAAVAGYTSRKTLLVLADETIVVPYTKTATPFDAFVRRYARDGTLLHTYPLGAVEANHVAHALDDPASFWVWSYLKGASQGLSRFDRLRVSDGTVVTTFQAAQFEGGGYQGPATSTPPLFGHSFSCPFISLPVPVAAFVPSGGGGDGGGDGDGGGSDTTGGWGTFPPIPPGRIRRVRRAPHLAAEQVEQFFARFQLELEAGVGTAVDPGTDPQIFLRWSDDGGHTWRAPIAVSAGMAGAFRRRALWRRLGRSRDRVFEVSMSDPVKWALRAASLDAAKGTS
jgi:hypothetical protein